MVCKGAAPPCNPTNYLLFLAFGWGKTGCVYGVVCEILCCLDLLPVYHRLRTFVPAGSQLRLKLCTDATLFSLLWSFLRKLFYLGLRSVRNYATPFHNFLQNYFTPFSSSQSGKANCESAVAH